MYVTVTRVSPTPVLAVKSFLAEEARILAGATEPSFKVTVTGNMGAYIKAGFVAALSIIGMLAF